MRNLVLPLVLLCGACSSTPQVTSLTTSSSGVAVTSTPATPSAPTDPLGKLAAFTLTDLKAASADAHAQTPPDQTAYQCYDYLIALIPTIQLPGGTQTVGAVMAFQRGRDINNGIGASSGMLKSLNLACAPLVIDTQTTLNKLVAVAGGSAALGGAIVPIPVMPVE